jgi:DNA-binding NarL/FixJ family response regulator
VRLLGRYLNSGAEAKKVRDLCNRAASEHVERSPAPAKAQVAKLSTAVQVEIAGRYQAGERPVDLASEYGISEWRVQELRKRFGLKKHPIGMSDDERDLAVLLFSQGLSFNKIGAHIGRDPKTVANELRLHGGAP